MSTERVPDITSALEQQFNATVRSIWGESWKALVDQSAVDTMVDLIKEKQLPPNELLREAVKSVRLDDLTYFLALKKIILGEDIEPEEKKLMEEHMQQEVEQFKLPTITAVLDSAHSLFDEFSIVQPRPDNLPRISDFYGPIFQGFLEPEEGYDAGGEFAVLLRDQLRALKQRAQKGRQEDFFDEHPEFWHYVTIAETLAARSTETD